MKRRTRRRRRRKRKKKAAEEDEEEEETASDAEYALEAAIQDDSKVKKVVELQPFIVNLADKEEARYLRMTVSLGVGEKAKVTKKGPDPIFLAKVKNAMLAVLSTKTSEDVLTVKGKSKLRESLLEAAQEATEEGHVEALYITDFIVQL